MVYHWLGFRPGAEGRHQHGKEGLTRMDFGARRAVSLAGIILPFLYLVGTVRADESGLRVDYDPPQLSVEARAESLGAVLRAIGAKVGFSVVETAPSSKVVTLSIRNASLDDVLRQLLRAKNHAMIYRVVGSPSAESGPIDRIVLFGDSVTATAAVAPPGGSSRDPRQAQDHGDAGAKTVLLAGPTSPQSWPESTPFLNPAPVDTSDPAAPPISVGEMLQAHAMAAAQGGQLAGTGANLPAPPQPASSTPPANLDAALAETTRRAQQALGTLIDGLATATRSLQQSLPAGRK
jgi:hypothetical protein